MPVDLELQLKQDGDGIDKVLGSFGQAASSVKVGFTTERSARIAEIQERGTVTIPARPAMRIASERARAKVQRRLQLAARRVLSGESTLEKELAAVGKIQADALRAAIRSGIGPANVVDRGIPGTLQVTGKMARDVGYEVE